MKKSRLGVGNDLFENTLEIKRIICPSKNAFQHYDEIIASAKLYNQEYLVLITLGQTATILAFNLDKLFHHLQRTPQSLLLYPILSQQMVVQVLLHLK